MRFLFLLLAFAISFTSMAQIDTVVIRIDSMFESKIHRKLFDNRTNVKYHLDEWAKVREMAVYMATVEEINTGKKMYGVRIDQRLNRNLFTDAPASNAEYRTNIVVVFK